MGKSLMIVDDSVTMRMIVRRFMRAAGFKFDRIVEAANGKEDLAELAQKPVDIMLVDVDMPVMGGEEMVREVRKISRYRDIRIAMVSKESRPELIASVLADGADAYILKPFTPKMLEERLTPLLYA
jgi:two-component system chemotaxis response regulator CheY